MRVAKTLLVPNSVTIHMYRSSAVRRSMCKSSRPGGKRYTFIPPPASTRSIVVDDASGGARTTCRWRGPIGP
jgi:hypothetical protein